ncbi:hypothetical protein BC826DRAFT_322111 [Russula brevipes]|nr:hypothetical protein BC826DRAFT_322111 [Russula brevipes]
MSLQSTGTHSSSDGIGTSISNRSQNCQPSDSERYPQAILSSGLRATISVRSHASLEVGMELTNMEMAGSAGLLIGTLSILPLHLVVIANYTCGVLRSPFSSYTHLRPSSIPDIHMIAQTRRKNFRSDRTSGDTMSLMSAFCSIPYTRQAPQCVLPRLLVLIYLSDPEGQSGHRRESNLRSFLWHNQPHLFWMLWLYATAVIDIASRYGIHDHQFIHIACHETPKQWKPPCALFKFRILLLGVVQF